MTATAHRPRSRIIGLYPRAWQERYGDELDALLEARPATIGDRVDLVRGALDARLHPQLDGPRRVRDRRGLAALAGFAILWLAVVIHANGPVQTDEFGTYRDGAMALPFMVLSVALLAVGLYSSIVRLPLADHGSAVAGIVAILAGVTWAAMPWVVPLFLVFLFGVLVLALGARRASLWSMPELAITVVAVAIPAGILVTTMFLPWYAMRVAGFNYLVVLAPLSCIWLVVASTTLRSADGPAPA